MSLRGSLQQKWVVRNRGGGTAACCANHPVAAPARINNDRSVQLKLEQRADDEGSRNGARVYFADECVEGHYHPDRYAALLLLGKTFSVTLDLSSALCSCNVAWYLVPMRSNTDPGTCDGDFYCDANEVPAGHVNGWLKGRGAFPLSPAWIVAWKIGMASKSPPQAAPMTRPSHSNDRSVASIATKWTSSRPTSTRSMRQLTRPSMVRDAPTVGAEATPTGLSEARSTVLVAPSLTRMRPFGSRPPARISACGALRCPKRLCVIRSGSRLFCHRRSRGLERDRDYAAADSRAGLTTLFGGAQLVRAAHECVL